jgi:hypothetical protein
MYNGAAEEMTSGGYKPREKAPFLKRPVTGG